MKRLMDYFTQGIDVNWKGRGTRMEVGMEVETSFIYENGRPITREDSQRMFRYLVEKGRWSPVWPDRKSFDRSFIPELRLGLFRDKILYDLGRQNIEIATTPAQFDRTSDTRLVEHAQSILEDVYDAAKEVGAKPLFAPILETEEDLLVVPDERDSTWISLDGRDALNLLARTSSVQFTVNVSNRNPIEILNRIGSHLNEFLFLTYPQDALWKRYIAESHAAYDPLRYGGPVFFSDLKEYCAQLARHAVVYNGCLIPFAISEDLDIPLFLRSVWWYFRLKRYGNQLCIEIRPLGRWSDEDLYKQFNFVMQVLDL